MDAMKIIINLNRCKDGDCDHCDYKRMHYKNSFDDGMEVCERERLDKDALALIDWLRLMINTNIEKTAPSHPKITPSTKPPATPPPKKRRVDAR